MFKHITWDSCGNIIVGMGCGWLLAINVANPHWGLGVAWIIFGLGCWVVNGALKEKKKENLYINHEPHP